MLTCSDIGQRLDAFVDSQLPPTDLLDVARHAAGCPGCEERIRQVTVLAHLVGTTVRGDAEALDLSRVWPAVEKRMDAVDHARRRERWRHPVRGRRVPVWGAGLAVAATAALWLQTAGLRVAKDDRHGKPSTQVARAAGRLTGKPMLNEAIVERLHSENVVQVKREPKDGTTVIWVQYQGTPAR